MASEVVLIEYNPGSGAVRIAQPVDRKGQDVSLANRRKRMGYTQRDLAKRAGISRTYLSQIEVGIATNLSLVVARRIAEALCCDVDDIFPSTYGANTQTPDSP